MAEYALAFWLFLMGNLLLIVFGSLHYRIDQSADKFYTALLTIGVTLMIGSGIGWLITRGG